MAKVEQSYDIAAVRRLLVAAFSAEDLRRFCQDRSLFCPIVDEFGSGQGKADMVDRVIDYCDTHHLFDELLDAVRRENPAQYAHHEPQLRAAGADEIALKILKPGSVLLSGRYRIVRHIARGGFGSAYLAEDALLHEEVAIKELIPALVGDEGALKRFLVEAKATMQLSHPHIVRARDVFAASGNYYMVMEHMPGGSLEDLIRARKALPVDEAVCILAEVCEGLAFAHERGVVHCDLKPSNILLTADGSAKVADFGVAHVSDQMVSRSWITSGGFVAGTLPYMSPEQTDGVRDDPRVDVYALGGILYRAVTGRMYLEFDERDTPRAQSDNVQRICTHEPVPPSSHNQRIPPWLDAAVLKALAKRPEDRYASVAEFRSALLGPPSGPPVLHKPPAPRPAVALRLRRLPARFWLVAGAVVVLAILLSFAVSRLGDSGRRATATVAPGLVARLTPQLTAVDSTPVAGPTPAPTAVPPTSTPIPPTAAPTAVPPTSTPIPATAAPTAMPSWTAEPTRPKPSPTPAGLVVDGFEDYGSDAALRAAYGINAAWGKNFGQLSLAFAPNVARGSQGVAFAYEIKDPAEAYAGFERTIPAQNWQPYSALHLWVRSDRSPRDLVIQFREVGGEVWCYVINLASFGDADLLLPLRTGVFQLAGWSPGQNERIDLGAIDYYALFVDHGTVGSGTIYVDDIRLEWGGGHADIPSDLPSVVFLILLRSADAGADQRGHGAGGGAGVLFRAPPPVFAGRGVRGHECLYRLTDTLRFLEFLFGWLKAKDLIGARGQAVGWYRRSPRPYLELRRLVLDNGKAVTGYLYPVTQFFVYAGLVAGAVLIVLAYVL